MATALMTKMLGFALLICIIQNPPRDRQAGQRAFEKANKLTSLHGELVSER